MELERKVELDWLLDFYGGLLTGKRREIVRLWCEEDMTLAELGQQFGITRQAACDALARAEDSLRGYERQLGLLARYRAITQAAHRCEDALDRLEKGDGKALSEARSAIKDILTSER